MASCIIENEHHDHHEHLENQSDGCRALYFDLLGAFGNGIGGSATNRGVVRRLNNEITTLKCAARDIIEKEHHDHHEQLDNQSEGCRATYFDPCRRCERGLAAAQRIVTTKEGSTMT